MCCHWSNHKQFDLVFNNGLQRELGVSLTNSFFPRDQIEEIPVVGDAVDLSAPPVVEIDAHGGVETCQVESYPVVGKDAYGHVESCSLHCCTLNI